MSCISADHLTPNKIIESKKWKIIIIVILEVNFIISLNTVKPGEATKPTEETGQFLTHS